MVAAERPVALVTGGARGIGLGISRALAADGFDLVVAGRRPAEEAAGAVAALEALGTAVLYCRADVAERADRAGLVETVRREVGRLDVLVNNAGVAPLVRADVLDATEESFDRLISVNLRGPYFLTQAVARWMIEQATARAFGGCIVTVTSISAVVASVSRGDYCISKAGLSMATRLWAVRLAEHGIPVYEVRPGVVETDMTASVHERYDGLIADGLLLQRRWGQPEDVGRAVAALARGDLRYSTGAVIPVDGGMLVERL
jgi:NAD(P)-dependent dehydrogenase (short-subunit alcohol dehydrogenase family)